LNQVEKNNEVRQTEDFKFKLTSRGKISNSNSICGFEESQMKIIWKKFKSSSKTNKLSKKKLCERNNSL